jgi:hypothetical protein
MPGLCIGCGRSLPERQARGRPAHYHGPACRQRARRARLGTDPGRVELLAVAEQAEHAAIALRRALTTGQDHDAAVTELLAAAATLATMRDHNNEDPPSPEQASTTQDGPITKSVTATATQPRPAAPAPEPRCPPASPTRRSGERVTKPSHEKEARQNEQERRPQPIDPNTVRLERSADYDITGTWRAIAGPADDPTLVGFVRRNGLSKKWEARTPVLAAVSGGPWRTRQDALVHLVLDHQATASRLRPR